jgi:hypothetical protein
MPVILPTQKAERDQEDHSSKPELTILRKTHHKKELVKWLKV